MLAIAAALLPLDLGIVLGGAGRFGLSSNAADRIVFGSVPLGGLVAMIAGITGWRRPRRRVLDRLGLFLGAVELLCSVIVLFVLLKAFRSFG